MTDPILPLAPSAAPTSPFKFLDAYAAQDSAVFFGRDDEIEALYRLLGESRLVLVYGQSGTGKTSLVQSGLAKKFSPTNWLPLTVRRGDSIGPALDQALAAAAITPIVPGTATVAAIRSVFLDHLRPVFLIFDQFEELYVLGSKAEQEAFYATIKAVLEADVSCRVIVLLREEYLAALDPFERAVPALFDKRLRVEVMTNSNVEKVILGTTSAHGIALEHGADTARLIIDQLDDKRVGVQLAYLQVYLDHLYRVAARGGGTLSFTDAQIAEAGKLGDIMAGFLDEQETELQTELEAVGSGIAKGGVARLLDEFVSVSGTKQPSTAAEIAARLPSSGPWLRAALTALQNQRLLRLVGDHYELAHDALAARIAQRRSSERKDLLEIAKIVSDRREGFERTNTMLTPDELGMVKRATAQKDTITGEALFVLNSDDAAFVVASRQAAFRAQWRGGLKYVSLLVISSIALVGMLVWVIPDPDAKTPEQINQGFNELDRNTTVMLSSLLDHGVDGKAAVKLLDQVDGFYEPFYDFAEFMGELRQIDVAVLAGKDKKAAERYTALGLKFDAAAAAPGATAQDRIKAKAVRWHEYWFGELEARTTNGPPLFRQISSYAPQQLGGADYGQDTELVCKDLAFERLWIEGCPALPPSPTPGASPVP